MRRTLLPHVLHEHPDLAHEPRVRALAEELGVDPDAASGRPDVVRWLAGATGVRAASGADPAVARARLPKALIGASAHSPAEAATLLEAGADYVTLSPIFLTESKAGYGPALGLGALRAASGAGPVIALAGIDESNAGECLAAGAKGVAVMGEMMRSADPEATVRRLLRALAEAIP